MSSAEIQFEVAVKFWIIPAMSFLLLFASISGPVCKLLFACVFVFVCVCVFFVCVCVCVCMYLGVFVCVYESHLFL